MKQEDKELLLKDLCARLPYGLQVQFFDEKEKENKIDKVQEVYQTLNPEIYTSQYGLICDNCKLLLRPFTNITEEEVMEWAKMKYGENSEEVKNFVSWKIFRYDTSCTVDIKFFVETEYGQQGYSTIFRISSDDCESIEFFDWLNAHHFDYRGLIRKKLALPADNMIYSNINKNNE